MPGNYCESGIPDPIPNSEVTPFSADGTVLRHGRVGRCRAKLSNENIIVVTGGQVCRFNLIEYLIKKTKYKIISIDNYSSGSKKIIFTQTKLFIWLEKQKILKISCPKKNI